LSKSKPIKYTLFKFLVLNFQSKKKDRPPVEWPWSFEKTRLTRDCRALQNTGFLLIIEEQEQEEEEEEKKETKHARPKAVIHCCQLNGHISHFTHRLTSRTRRYGIWFL